MTFEEFVQTNLGDVVTAELLFSSPKLSLYLKHYLYGQQVRPQPTLKANTYSYPTDEGEVSFVVDRTRACDMLYEQGRKNSA